MGLTKEGFRPLRTILGGVVDFLVGNPPREVPENVPREARQFFAQAKKTAYEYLVIIESILRQNPIKRSLDQPTIDWQDEAVISDLMIEILTHRMLEQRLRGETRKQRLKDGVTAVCERLTQMHALEENGMGQGTFSEYCQVARKAANLVIKLNESGAKSFDVRTQTPPLLTHMRLLRLGEKY